MDSIIKLIYVKFGKLPNGLAYLANGVEANIGDFVIVEEQATSKEVIAIKEFKIDELPVSFDRLKKVIRKVEPNKVEPIKTVCVDTILKQCDFLTVIEDPINKVLGRDREIQMLVESMYKKRMKNTVLVGPAGSGKTAIIEAFAEQVKDDYIVMELNQSGMISGTRYRGDYEEKIINALNQIIEYNNQNEKKIILFIDEIHTIVDSGASSSMSAGDIIKTYLSKMQINVIGATTNAEFEKYLAHDAALCRRLSPIFINELTDDVVLGILDDFAEKEVDEGLLKTILKLSKTLKIHSMPDTPIEILDRCLAKKKCYKTEITEKMILEIVSDMNSTKGAY